MEYQNRQKEYYRSIPKVELHRHLEGSLRLSTMREIAQQYDLDLPYDDVPKFRSLVQVIEGEQFNFQNFLSKFTTLRNFYQSPEIIRQVTREAIADAALDNIRYMELRFTPVALTRIKEFPLSEAMDWVVETAKAVSKEYSITTRLIASVNRHESIELAEAVAELAVERIPRGIVGIDLAGSEAEFPGAEFEPVFRHAQESGLRVTIHAGEWGGPEMIDLAINTLRAERIGHGVRVLEDQNVVRLAREKQIAFEVCPTSNYQSGVVAALADHPLPQMLDAGLLCTLNTDDPGISRIDLSDEYEIGSKVLGLSEQELIELVLNAVHCSFLPGEEKILLKEKIQREIVEFLRG